MELDHFFRHKRFEQQVSFSLSFSFNHLQYTVSTQYANTSRVVTLKTTVELLLEASRQTINQNMREKENLCCLLVVCSWVLWPRSLDEIQGRHRRRPVPHPVQNDSQKQLAYSASVKNNAKCMLCWRRPKTDRGQRPVTPCELKKICICTVCVCADCLRCNVNNRFLSVLIYANWVGLACN